MRQCDLCGDESATLVEAHWVDDITNEPIGGLLCPLCEDARQTLVEYLESVA